MNREQIEKKIDPAEAGISMAGLDGPSAYINGKEKYRRIFIRLRTPQETLTCSPIEGGKDFAQRASIIENWFIHNKERKLHTYVLRRTGNG